ncbi:MAG: NAD-dependent deacylase [Rhizobiaceae bacterium]|nr:NAD-dependent deacylase [Rhizobiaceae bacterium]
MARVRSIVILTGAGISAESGVDTFRAKDGIWSKYDYRDVATPEGFVRNPKLVFDFYNMRRRGLAKVKPNAAHEALARLEEAFPGDVLVVTQNIDDLHERAGTKNLIHMHGELERALCTVCESRSYWPDDMKQDSACPACGTVGYLRPDVVWFGEMPYHMDHVHQALAKCDLFLSIGTSGNVYPAAGFVDLARAHGAHTVELNLEPSEGHSAFHDAIQGKATKIVPDYVDRILMGD